jgi:hypothetical protein
MLKTFTSNFKWLGEGDDPFLMVSAECKSESGSVRLEIEKEFAAGNFIQHSCKDAGGKVFKFEFEGTCPYRIEASASSGDFNCLGTSCTTKEYQASADATVTAGNSSYEGCSNFKVSSGAFSLGTAGCVLMAGLLLSTIALLN